jgi:iron complex outermembrane receptor protein
MRHRASTLHARLLAGVAAVALVASWSEANAQEKEFNIPSQSLASALNQFGAQSDTAVMVKPSLLGSKMSRPVTGSADIEVALQSLLDGSGLAYRREGDTFLIVQAAEGGDGPQERSAYDGSEVEALIVTAQKKEEAIQDVPIAISAFTQKSLDAQKIEGGFDLLKAIPNVTFSKSNFSGYNFSIRGIGTKAVSATTDPGVAVAFNNSTLIVNRLFEQEYFDVERVEVLRGPQGTLYGRNATSGVINVLSARPRLGEFEGEVKLEAGNYNAQRARGMINVPIGDTLALRFAGAMTMRDGYGINLAATDPDVIGDVAEDVDNRDLWSTRLTVGWEPIEQIRVNAMWERFEEDDRRVRTSKQLCHRDPGPETTGSFDWTTSASRDRLSQGCVAGSLYAPEAFGTPNGASLPYIGAVNFIASIGPVARGNFGWGAGGNPYYYDPANFSAPCPAYLGYTTLPLINPCQSDPYGGQMQSADLRTIHSAIEPSYRASANVYELSIDLDLTDNLTFTSQTVYADDKYFATQDYNRFAAGPIFTDTSIGCDLVINKFGLGEPDCAPEALGTYGDGHYNVAPRPAGSPIGTPGVFVDPQLGPSNTLVAQDLSKSKSDQFNQEFRLASNFDAPVNFSMGANFTRFETLNDYYVFINVLTMLTGFYPFGTHNESCDYSGPSEDIDLHCLYVDPNPIDSLDGEGHNYFRSANPYELTSSALFGELYWQATDTLKVTLGARMTWDRKVFTPLPSQLLLIDYRKFSNIPEGAGPEMCVTPQDSCPIAGTGIDGRGSVALPDIVQEWREPTGRIIVDWKPDLSFTDETMVYGSISHGYKGGGANPPGIAPPAAIFNLAGRGAAPLTFDPEYINAFEVGTKNTLLGGSLILNGSAFRYDYEGYQVSKILDRSAANENFDSKIWGVELEWIYSPMRNLRFNGTFGALRTEIAKGERSIDLMDRTQGLGAGTYLDADGVEHTLKFDQWIIVKDFLTNSSNCIIPVDVVEHIGQVGTVGDLFGASCPGGGISGRKTFHLPDGRTYTPGIDAPNGGTGFYDEIGGNELPNAPHWTASLGAQYRLALPGGWDATLRGDFYWQDESFARVYNTEYDRLKAWTNTNISLWVENPDWGVTAEVYVKNAFDETPITDAFLNSDDSGLTTNVFTLDPRLVGVSVRKSF